MLNLKLVLQCDISISCRFYPENCFSSRQWLVVQPGGLTLGLALNLTIRFVPFSFSVFHFIIFGSVW